MVEQTTLYEDNVTHDNLKRGGNNETQVKTISNQVTGELGSAWECWEVTSVKHFLSDCRHFRDTSSSETEKESAREMVKRLFTLHSKIPSAQLTASVLTLSEYRQVTG